MIRLFLAALLAAPALAKKESEAPRALPEFRLTAVTAQKAATVSRRDFEGKVWVANFMFTRCSGPCPLNSSRMQGLQRDLPEDIRLVSFTVDPLHDQARQLKAYARKYQARPDRWMFLTAGDEETLIPLYKDYFRTAYRVSKTSPCGYETYHSEKFFLIDASGAIRGEYAGGKPEDLARLRQEARALAARSNQGAKAK